MIRTLTIQNFKSIERADIEFGPLTFLIGPNAGGKSNLLDGIRVLQGLATGFSVRDVLDGRHEEATRLRWQSIRGGSRFVLHKHGAPQKFSAESPEVSPDTASFKVHVGGPGIRFSWEVSIDPLAGRIRDEEFVVHEPARGTIFTTRPGGLRIDRDIKGPTITAQVTRRRGRGRYPHFDFSASSAILPQLRAGRGAASGNKELADKAAEELVNLQFLDPSPDALRAAVPLGHKRMGDHGELFASVSEAIWSDPALKTPYLNWIQELTPCKITDLHFFHSEVGETRFGIVEEGIPEPIPSMSVSDGTLRFAAIVTALFQPEAPRVLLIEEVENGIHATRLRLLIDALRQMSAESQPQVIATTHSPQLLGALTPEDYTHVVFVSRDPETGDSSIRPVLQIPSFSDAVKRKAFDQLLSEGWLEASV